jgi:hypothetical protein
MPRLSGWFVRASLFYLAAGFALGAVMLAGEGLGFDPFSDRLPPIHMEFLLSGWLVQLALGVVYWILPRNVAGLPRGNEMMAWLSLVFLNAGILFASTNTVINTSWLGFIGRGLETASAVLFLFVAWRRVRPSR